MALVGLKRSYQLQVEVSQASAGQADPTILRLVHQDIALRIQHFELLGCYQLRVLSHSMGGKYVQMYEVGGQDEDTKC